MTLLNNNPRRKFNWNGHVLRRNCVLHDITVGQMTEMKGVGSRRKQPLDYMRNKILEGKGD